MTDLDTDPVGVFEQHIIIPGSPAAGLRTSNDCRAHFSQEPCRLVDVLATPGAKAEVVQADARLDKSLAAVGLILTPLTTEAGEWLYDEKRRHTPIMQEHVERGEWMIYISLALLIVAIALAVMHWLEGRSDSRRTVATAIIAIVALLVGVSSIVGVYRIGDAGAQSVWGDGG